MNSPKKINYELRPVKFTERKMLLSFLQKICAYYGNNYQYIGFGGLSFTDFKLFHKELHIDELISIEGGKFSIEKLSFNSPFSFIKIIKSFSTCALNTISFDQKSIIWLDYDGTLSEYFFDDLRLIFSKILPGSIYIITCNRELKSKETNSEYTINEFKEIFGNKIPFKLNNKDFSSANNFKTIRIMLMNHISKIVKERNNAKSHNSLKFRQLFNILYQEYSGAKMFTFGGILISEEDNLDDLYFEDFNFISKNEIPYKLTIPNLTRKERDLINAYLFTKEEELITKNIITKNELELYKETYKYLPNYYDIRL